jgi:hypothetical protein
MQGGETVKVKNGNIMAAIQAIARIGETLIQQQTAWRISRNLKQLQEVAKEINKDHRELLKFYGAVEIPGGGLRVPDTIKVDDTDVPNPKFKEVQEAFTKLMDEEAEVEIRKVSLSGFSNISINAINALEFMIIEDVEEFGDKNIIRMPARKQ